MTMSSGAGVSDWRKGLPVLAGRIVELRELRDEDCGALLEVLSSADASPFGMERPLCSREVQRFIERALAERRMGLSFTYAVIAAPSHILVGLFQVRRLEPSFETAAWDCTLAASARGT